MLENDNQVLKGTRYIWITGEENLTDAQADQLKKIKWIAKKTSTAWRLEEIARSLWGYTLRVLAVKAWRS